ncbi:hypothetical protein FTX61_03640 [Nitriliruptoraceae bacterium ZYF776]|nr:hypothetical protein [Profundirhabdus halotolerans]
MGALDDLTRLAEADGDLPPHDGRELFRSRRRRRARRRVAGGTVATFAVALVAWIAWPGVAPTDRVIVDEVAGADGHASGTLLVPERGSASADYLDDGTPVFVSHAEDGTVRVLDAHDRHFAGKMVVFCPGIDRLLEPRAGSSYLLDGTYAGGGPSPADLSRYPAELTDDGTSIEVTGPVVLSDGRGAAPRDFTDTRCDNAVRHEPDRSAPETPLREAVPDDGSWGWAYVRLEVLDDLSLILCHALFGCAAPQEGLMTGDRVPTAADVEAGYPETQPRWALVRDGSDGVEVRYAVRDIELNTGPRTDLDEVRSSIGWSPRHLVRITDAAGEIVTTDGRLRLRFDPDGWFSADLPCTTRYGRFELLPGEHIRFSDVRATSAGTCDDEGLEAHLAAVLDDGARTLRVSDNDLHLVSEEGRGLDYSWSPPSDDPDEAP